MAALRIRFRFRFLFVPVRTRRALTSVTARTQLGHCAACKLPAMRRLMAAAMGGLFIVLLLVGHALRSTSTRPRSGREANFSDKAHF